MSASREKRLRREIREAEENSDIVVKRKKKKQTPAMSRARAQKIKTGIGSAIVIILVVAFALLIFVNSGFLQQHATALTVGSYKLSPAEFNYYYQDTFYNTYYTYSSYGLWDYMVSDTEDLEDQECFMSDDGETWKDYLTDTATDNALQVLTLYDQAVQAGYTLDEEDQASLDSNLESISTYAESNGYNDADDYLESYYGKGATMETYTTYMTRQQVASSYAEQVEADFDYSTEELRTYYTENEKDFDTITYRVFDVTTEDDDTTAAKETADAMNAELDGSESSFIEAAQEYAPEDEAESYEDESYTLHEDASYSSIDESYADWLYTGLNEGDHEVFATETGYSVVMFVSREDNQYNTVDVRHILIQVDTSGDDDTSTDEDWENCEAAIDEVQAAWEETDMTEDDFAALAEEYSEDTGSSSNGGLYEDVYKGEMVQSFEDWCFDPDRQVGDTGIVKSDYGYHFMYFVGTGDPYWESLADEAKRSEDYDAWYEEKSAAYTADKSWFGLLFTDKTLQTS